MKILLIFVVCVICSCASENRSRALEVSSTPFSSANMQSNSTSNTVGSVESKRWSEQRIVNYDMTVSLETTSYIEPARSAMVKVRDATAISIVVADERDRRDRLYFYEPYKTVELMYARIAELRQRTGKVEVKYNEQYGYPEEIKYLEANPDASFTFRVLSLRAVE